MCLTDTHTHTYTHSKTHTHTHTQTHTHTHASTQACMHTHTHTHTRARARTYTHTALALTLQSPLSLPQAHTLIFQREWNVAHKIPATTAHLVRGISLCEWFIQRPFLFLSVKCLDARGHWTLQSSCTTEIAGIHSSRTHVQNKLQIDKM